MTNHVNKIGRQLVKEEKIKIELRIKKLHDLCY